ncbi:uncharacterized protein LOC131629131 [Vicia villosa]|uniref:uncharacterized protein LOC131629131 n=1 Tax=Vicia villosa TaxID=3911 RepID=UPI00273B15B5|nr:uncharacterized protein LOC131629131 [Vicia villosa]
MVFSSHMSVMVNGSPTKEFLVEKGLRQGDPLSSFLFVVVAEGLKGIINKVVENGSYAGFSINRRCFIDVIQFADDTLMVEDGSWSHLWAIKAVLRGFELISGPGIKFYKSKLIGLNIDSRFLEVATTFLACRRKDKIFKFLGVYIRCNPRRIISWEPLMSNIKKRLASWKGSEEGGGGNHQDSEQFSMGLRGERRCIHWASWETVCLPIEKGGLGIRRINDFNVALLYKWKWRILEEAGSLWHEVLKARYGDLKTTILIGAAYNKGKDFTSIWWVDILALDNHVAKDFFNQQCRFLEVSIASIRGWGNGVWLWGNFGVSINQLSVNTVAAELAQMQQHISIAQPACHGSYGVEWIQGLDGSF